MCGDTRACVCRYMNMYVEARGKYLVLFLGNHPACFIFSNRISRWDLWFAHSVRVGGQQVPGTLLSLSLPSSWTTSMHEPQPHLAFFVGFSVCTTSISFILLVTRNQITKMGRL